jgi:hypothetical protein
MYTLLRFGKITRMALIIFKNIRLVFYGKDIQKERTLRQFGGFWSHSIQCSLYTLRENHVRGLRYLRLTESCVWKGTVSVFQISVSTTGISGI